MKVALKFLLVASLCKLILSSGHFTVIGSKSVKQNGKYSVAITSRNFDDSDPPILEVAILSENGVEKVAQNITLTNGKKQSLEFDMKGPIVGNYMNLSINCIRGLNFNKMVKLNLNTRNVSAFVQTDKAIYKPSDEVRFRVLVLDESLKPLNAKDVQIFVFDSNQNPVKQIQDAVFEKGVFEGRYKLSDSPVLGNWHIVALVYGNIEDKKPFEVAEYTLPTFELILDVKPHVSFADGQITAFLSAKYTFGQVARGSATITAQVDNRTISKSVEVSDNTSVEFDIKNELGLDEEHADRTVKLFVMFIEKVTDKEQNASTTIQVHAVPYKLQIKTKSNEFKPGLPYTIEALVQYHDDNAPLTDNMNPVTFRVTFVEETNCHWVKEHVGKRKSEVSFKEICTGGLSTVRESKVYPTNGTSKIDFVIPGDIVRLDVTVTYLKMKLSRNEILRASSEDDHFITIMSKTEIPKLKENVKINIQSTKHFTEFSYHVFSIQGRLIATDTIQVFSTMIHDFEFTPTPDTEREIKIIVFYITDKGEIVFDSMHLEFDELRNFVDVQIPDESVYPNNSTEISVTSSPNSLVGLSGIAQSASVLKSVIDFTDKIKGENRSDVFFIIHPGSKSFIPFSGLSDSSGSFYDEDEEDEKDSMKSQVVEYRKSFPETWLFEIVNFDVNQANAVISRNVPDTITTWTITAFSIHPTTGLAIIRRPVTLTVSKPLFMAMDLPYSIKRNEIVSIPISVFNYLEDDQDVNITFHNADAEFTFIELENTRDGQPTSYKQRTKSLHVNRKSGASTSFKIRADRIGSIKIKVSATSLSSSQSDGIERDLLVKPEGITTYMNEAVFIDLTNTDKYTTNLNITIPQAAVNGTTKIKASIIGDILGLSGNLRNLLRLPVGSSEQNMINFVPSIAVLDYLTAVNKLTPEARNEVSENLELVYQKQLNYKNDDGSFNVWGKHNESGSTWITAFLVKSFDQAKKYIFVDSDIIEKGLRFLSQTQLEDGSFEEVGYIFRKDSSSNRIALTAYVLITFLENADYVNTYNRTVVKALSFLSLHFNNITDNHSLAIVAYAVQLAHVEDEHFRIVSLSKLEMAAIKEGETMHWVGSVPELHDDASDNKANSLDIETTAYALQAFLKAGHLRDSVQITKWLVSQRNENGGFISTQDTVVALQALSDVATNMYSSNTNMAVTLYYGVDESLPFYVNKWNALLLQTENLPSEARDFRITARGEGFGIFQISYQHNMDYVDEMHSSTARFNISRAVVNRTVNPKKNFLETCVNYIPYEERATSNLAVLEVKFPTGSKFEGDFSKELESTEGIKGVNYLDTSVIVYFDHLSTHEVCPQFHFSNVRVVENTQHGSIDVFDFHDPKHRASKKFIDKLT